MSELLPAADELESVSLTDGDRALLDLIARLAVVAVLGEARMDRGVNDNGETCTDPPAVQESRQDGRP